MNNKLPLFDIDGTISKPGNPLHHHAFHIGFKKVFGFPATIDKIEVSGMLDRQIILAVLEYHKKPVKGIDDKLDEIFREMSKYFTENAFDMRKFLLPGVEEILLELKTRKYPIGLLTGNVETIAWSKMKCMGIDGYFDRFGGFGDANVEKRSDLIPIAVERANSLTGRSYSDKDVVIIGDTPRDIRCAREKGSKVIAVATGRYDYDLLKELEPDLLLRSMEEKEKVLEFLFNNHDKP